MLSNPVIPCYFSGKKMMTAITSLPKQKKRDLPSFPSTSSDTLVTWSFQEKEPVTMSVSQPHNGIIRWYDPITGRWLSNDPIGISGGLNQYVAFGNNPVMFRDPWGLKPDEDNKGVKIESGDAYVRDYIYNLRPNWHWLLILPLRLEELAKFAQSDGRDIKYRRGRQFEYRGAPPIRGDQMGNRGPAYAMAEVWGPVQSAALCIGAEVFFALERAETWKVSDMTGSFKDNALGIGAWLVDNPIYLVAPLPYEVHRLFKNIAGQVYHTPLGRESGETW